MLKIFIGFDKDEPVAFHVLAQSIIEHASKPVAIIPLVLHQLPMTREREADQSTDFSFSRYLVPHLCDYQGQAIYLDCDMLVRFDIYELLKYIAPMCEVSVVKHDYTPIGNEKFLDKTQTIYERKNWSSVMVFNNANCDILTADVVNNADSAWLRQLRWANYIGSLPIGYNHLVGEYAANAEAKLIHYTLGTPCFAKYRECEFSKEWYDMKAKVNYHNRIGECSKPLRDEQ